MPERIQKLLSACGIASRRQAEQLIMQGRVTINGAPAHLGDRANLEADKIVVDGKRVTKPADHTYLMLNKPRGYVTTMRDEQGRHTVRELTQDCGVRVFPVGRLDLNSEGLLLLTNDGEVAYRVTHPSHEVEKEYFVWVSGNVNAALPILCGRIILDGVLLRPAAVRLVQEGNVSLLSVTIHEGRNRQVRRMCRQAGLNVVRLKRMAEGKLRLGDLRAGQWRYLEPEEVAFLKQL
ncbi:MAG: pseudouridine synthase [Oscillospiraceae bacterium]|nr:pseudouridine synthase [Oscillospiraceae bacterium]